MKQFLNAIVTVVLFLMSSVTSQAQDQIYLVGQPQNWNIEDSSMALNQTSPGVYSGKYQIAQGEFSFRFYTQLGDWENNSLGSNVEDTYTYISFLNGDYFGGYLTQGKGSWSYSNWPGGDLYIKVDLNNNTVLFSTQETVTNPDFIKPMDKNEDSGIANAKYTMTLEDGTILGFRDNWNTYYFCGAISTASKIEVPSYVLSDTQLGAVEYIGYNDCDFSRAQSVKSLNLPPTVSSIYHFPSTVEELHLRNYMSYVDSDKISHLQKLYVPEEYLSDYYDTENWASYVLILAEGRSPLKLNIAMSKAGEFAQTLLEQTHEWYGVNELTVTGELNEDDLNVFKRMKQLTYLDLSGASITALPDNFGCKEYTTARTSGLNILETLELPKLESIGDYAFVNTRKLKNIEIPGVKRIGYQSFMNTGLGNIILPEDLEELGDRVFYGSSLESIIIPSNVTRIPDYCFYEATNLKSVTIPASVEEIGYNAFYKSAVREVELPGVAKIQSYAFYNCRDLERVKFSDNLNTLGYEAFRECGKLADITLPGSLITIESSPFYACDNIKKVTSMAVIPPCHDNANYFLLQNCDMTDVVLYVPSISIDSYRAEGGWKNFYTILPVEEKISKAVIFDKMEADNADLFTTDLDLTLNWSL